MSNFLRPFVQSAVRVNRSKVVPRSPSLLQKRFASDNAGPVMVNRLACLYTYRN